MSVGKICQRDVDLAEAEESVTVAAERMHQRTVGALVIVDDHKVPVGIVTDRDLVVRVLAAGKNSQVTLVGEAMTAYPTTVSEEASIGSAVSTMRSGGFRRLPVVNRDGELAGIVTADDILVLLSEELSQIGKLVEGETPRAAAEVPLRR